MNKQDTIIIGAGLAGLCCARRLVAAGQTVRVVEAADAVGGRVRTDLVDGFRLDRGFQVFSTAYPEAKVELDYDSLNLKPFELGALVHTDGQWRRVSDARRQPSRLLEMAFSPVATLRDKWRLRLLVNRLQAKFAAGTLPGIGGDTVDTLDELSTAEYLQRYGFSSTVIDKFFRPFFSGVFLEEELATSSRMFEFVFAMFSLGKGTLPAEGMQAIPNQLAKALPEGTVQLNCSVETTDDNGVTLVGGERLEASAVVVATDQFAAAKLLGEAEPTGWRSVRTYYYAAKQSPLGKPILALNADGGPINSLCVPSDVASTYAPAGEVLVSVTQLGEADEAAIRQQLAAWYGADANDWRLIKTYDIRHALPNQLPPVYQAVVKSPQVRLGFYRAGDYQDTASINGAMRSGRLTAEAVLQK